MMSVLQPYNNDNSNHSAPGVAGGARWWRGRPVGAGAVVAFAVWALVACKGGSGGMPPVSPVVPVVVQALQTTQVQDTMELDGTVAAAQQVNLVARVAGYLEKVHFKDGDRVKAGQVLFTIEQEPYLQQVRLNKARVDQARSDYERQSQLLKENATAKSSVESSLSNLEQAQANLRLAEINLGYTTIKAPFDGVLGRRVVDAGNYVGASPGGTVLATLMQVSPVYVYASVGEREALRVRQKMALQGQTSDTAMGHTPVRALLQGEDLGQVGDKGVLDFIDRQAGQSAGAVSVRGSFANARQRLVPGFYAMLVVDLGEPRQALAVPARAVLSDQQGEYVFTVGTDGVAHRRQVRTVALPQERREVLSGLTAGEQLVVEGYARLSEGAKVAVKPAAAPAGATPAAAQAAPAGAAAVAAQGATPATPAAPASGSAAPAAPAQAPASVPASAAKGAGA